MNSLDDRGNCHRRHFRTALLIVSLFEFSMITSSCKNIANSPAFNRFIITTIILAGIIVGAQTYQDFSYKNAILLSFLDRGYPVNFYG